MAQVVIPDAYQRMEIDRKARIAANKKRLADLEVQQAAQDLSKTMRDQDRAKKPNKPNKPKRVSRSRVVLPPEALKRSSRLQNKEPVKYCELPEREPRTSKGRTGGKKEDERVYNMPTIADLRDKPWEAWQATPNGWKPQFGTASAEAAAAAERAAEEFKAKLQAQGRMGLPKHMSNSQVSGGFWCQCPTSDDQDNPWSTSDFYGNKKRDVYAISWDQTDRPGKYHAVVKGTEAIWKLVYNPRNSGGGWSGGWRGFAIDHMLTPVDTVVFEVMDNEEGEAEQQKARDMVAAKQAAQQQQQQEEETEGTGAVGDGGEGPSSSGASCEGEGEGEGEEEGEVEEDQPAKKTKRATVYKDVPSNRKFVRVHIFRASTYESEEEKQKQEAAKAAAAADAAAGHGATAAKDAAADAAKAAKGAAAEAVDAATAAEQAAGVAAAAAAGSADAAEQGTRKRRASRDAAAPSGEGSGTAAEPKPKKQQKQKSGKAAAGAGSSKKRGRAQEQEEEQAAGSKKKVKGASGKGAAAGAGKLVPYPHNKKVLVPAPTRDEERRNVSSATFVVERIMAHKVVKGKDEFLVRWETFGPVWDEWVSADCLNAAPHTYDWEGGAAAMPAKFRPGKGK